MKVGEFFRTPWGDIGKITNIPKHDKYQDDGFYLNGKFIICGREAMKKLKSTPDIMDLIEVGDYVNGCRVEENNGLGYFIILQNGKSKWLSFKGLAIKSIVTKEQFENCMYKVGE